MRSRLLFILICMSAVTGCGRFEGTFRFLRDEPNKESIPGVFTLDHSSYSYAMLQSMGYTDLSVRVDLRADGTFAIYRMPDCWLTDFGDSKGGYDSCYGTWSVNKSHSVYTVSLSIDRWSDHSTYIRERKSTGLGYTGAFTLTKEKQGYGLALSLAAGDKGYVYFLREKEANQALEPTALAVTPRACARVAPAKAVAHL